MKELIKKLVSAIYETCDMNKTEVFVGRILIALEDGTINVYNDYKGELMNNLTSKLRDNVSMDELEELLETPYRTLWI